MRKTVLQGTDNVQGKYPGTFLCQMEAIVEIIFQKIFATRSFENWGIFLDIPSFSWGILSQMMCLDKSHTGKNI